jgi:uncharacterized protein YjbJ (UPF0337 family)
MNTDQLQGKWKQAKGSIKERWGKLTDDDMDVINGQRDQLIGKVQQRYGIAKEEAQKQVDEFMHSHFQDTKESDLQRRRAS